MVKDPSLRFGIQDHCDGMGPMTMSSEGEIERGIFEGLKTKIYHLEEGRLYFDRSFRENVVYDDSGE